MSQQRYIVPVGRTPVIAPRLRLYCFHHAGGSAGNFAKWPAGLPSFEVRAIQLPHRFLPAGVARASHLDELLPGMADEVAGAQADALPFAFYGHSLGALVAFELTRTLRARGGPQPVALAISGHRAPHRRLGRPPICELEQTAFIDRLRGLGGMPESVLTDTRTLSYILPTLRADLRLSEIYDHRDEPPLLLPLFGFRGKEDPLLNEADFGAWADITRGPSVLRTLPGHHFFEQEGLEALHAHLAADLTPLANRPTRRRRDPAEAL
ncbi:thioesterase II family protein [Ralstonia flaminis]|jgi:medium-chain acyl-[acyl-carrier-protein] hydrolase|uniref:Thioesterase PikA5 n=1 Tax=Ralstonia flaminis TaxID=3058597 RepID=A0ABM9K278_9RALS|nr:thioesterase domain-containing protein [Ralstonia sp. LMG 18101]CAJ0809883.1 Thioesterase PikA5 [Ralstonia sp. LMG 18101]